uniref:Uncharacterized protein n=1 Tax=Anopheles minimus TaxID=112268 RepID=A0A182WQ05_9DIPT
AHSEPARDRATESKLRGVFQFIRNGRTKRTVSTFERAARHSDLKLVGRSFVPNIYRSGCL